MKSLVIIVFAVTAYGLCSAKYLSEKPSFLQSCSRADSNFNKCTAHNFQSFFKEWKDGIPGLKSIGSIDPLTVKRIKISQDANEQLTLHADLQNMIVKGASKTIVESANLDTSSYEVHLKMPQLHYDLDYRVKGLILALPLNGQGTGFFETENSIVTLKGAMKLRKEGDLSFFDVQSLKVTVEHIGNFRITLNNLFGGQRDLEDAANSLFNDNWRELYEILRPVVEQTMEAVFFDRLKKMFNFVPANYYLADDAL